MTDKPTTSKKFGTHPDHEIYANLQENASYDMLLSHGAEARPAAAMKDLITESGINNGQPLDHQDFDHQDFDRQLQQKPESQEHPKLVARLGIPDHMQSFFDRSTSPSKE